ncbi:hypothetical protein HPB48_020304 [Haemaphysalis longicornis]|uniref:PiggyBac transposable element-derived protein domain-containing protein n=1 Tax=Haemaphysalis longicornis TaxID=44386 RepID=A0A9J6GV76_HAELO|nr:hypothetical protein HPB48_020304 [Haemaphysalis longicornis]
MRKNEYLANFEVYQGKQEDSEASTQYEKGFRKAAAPLRKMVYELPVEVRDLLYHFYFDNLFTNLHLLGHLKEKNYEATGTVRKTVCPKNAPSLGLISSNARPVGTKSTRFQTTG